MVVHDILTLAPALAAELEGVPVATLIPHVYPVGEPGFPPYAFGARLPRTAAGRALWRALRPAGARRACERGRDELNDARRQARAGAAWTACTAASARSCRMVGTFPSSSTRAAGPTTCTWSGR